MNFLFGPQLSLTQIEDATFKLAHFPKELLEQKISGNSIPQNIINLN